MQVGSFLYIIHIGQVCLYYYKNCKYVAYRRSLVCTQNQTPGKQGIITNFRGLVQGERDVQIMGLWGTDWDSRSIPAIHIHSFHIQYTAESYAAKKSCRILQPSEISGMLEYHVNERCPNLHISASRVVISSKSFIYIIIFNNYHDFQPHEFWQWKMYNIQKLSGCMICCQIFDTIKRNLNCKISYFLCIIMRFWLQASLELCNAILPLDPLSCPFYFCFIPTLAQLVILPLRH